MMMSNERCALMLFSRLSLRTRLSVALDTDVRSVADYDTGDDSLLILQNKC